MFLRRTALACSVMCLAAAPARAQPADAPPPADRDPPAPAESAPESDAPAPQPTDRPSDPPPPVARPKKNPTPAPAPGIAPRQARDFEVPEEPRGPLPAKAKPASRPGSTVGIGVGYEVPADLDRVSTFGVRFRAANGLSVEPLLQLSTAGRTIDRPVGDSDEDGQTSIGVGALVRFPVASRGPVDIVGVAVAAIGRDSEDPDGPGNENTFTSAGLAWGVGVDYWISRHVAVSLNATNPLVTYVKTSLDEGDFEQTTASAGLTWNPTGLAMVYLYY